MQSHRLAVLVAAVSACAPDAAFHCSSTEQCRADGQTGTCETTGLCSFPDPSCPSGSRYMDGSGDGCVDVSSGVDRDGDGVADAGDNCPEVANADQGNEDGDTLGDVCDPCPADPDPSCVAPAHLLGFEGFHHGLPAGWTLTGGAAMASGDSLVITPGSGAALLTLPYTATTTITVSAGVSPVMLPGSSATGAGGIVVATNGTDMLACVLDDTASTQTLKVEYTALGLHASKPWTFAVEVAYTLTATSDLASSATCSAADGSANTTAAISLSSVVPATWKKMGIYAEGMPIRVDWVMLTSN